MAKFKAIPGKQLRRWEINLWEGLNTLVADNLNKKGELAYAENARSTRIGWLEKRPGHAAIGTSLSATNNYGLYDFITDRHTLIRISKIGGKISLYRYNVNENSWLQLSGDFATGLSEAECDFTTALSRCFVVNGTNNNRYIESDGSSVIDSSQAGGHLYNSPIAKLTNFYKERIYLGDYRRVDGTRERTGICFSSMPLGIVALVNGDQTQPITTLNVTDTKYIKVGSANDSLDIYRGGTLIGTITVTGKTENSLTISSFGTDLNSNDELWVAGTRSGEKIFRWDNRATGISVRQYDSFRNISSEDLTLMTNIGTDMLIFTANSMATWNGSYLRSIDGEIGCVSKKSFVKMFGKGIFLHYTGIYSTEGGIPQLLSAKIQPIFDNADRSTMEKACAVANEFSYFVHIGTVTFYNNNGSVRKILPNVVVEYNLRQNNFYIHTDVPMSHMTSFVKNNTRIVAFAKDQGIDINVVENIYVLDTAISGLGSSVNDAITVSESVTVSIA